MLTGMFIRNRLAPNVSEETARQPDRREFGEQFRMYLRDMGVDTELLDIVDSKSEVAASDRNAARRMAARHRHEALTRR